MRTVIVWSALSETTVPTRTFGRPVVGSCTDSVGSCDSLAAALRFSRSLTRRRRRWAALRLRSSARSAWRSPAGGGQRRGAGGGLGAGRRRGLGGAGGGGGGAPGGAPP